MEVDNYQSLELKKSILIQMVASLTMSEEKLLDQIILNIKYFKSSSVGILNQQIKPEDILYLKALSNYTEIFLSNGRKVLLAKTLKQLTLQLPESIFLRVHKSYIVNKLFMKQFITLPQTFVVLENDTIIPVSRQKRSFVKGQF